MRAHSFRLGVCRSVCAVICGSQQPNTDTHKHSHDFLQLTSSRVTPFRWCFNACLPWVRRGIATVCFHFAQPDRLCASTSCNTKRARAHTPMRRHVYTLRRISLQTMCMCILMCVYTLTHKCALMLSTSVFAYQAH